MMSGSWELTVAEEVVVSCEGTVGLELVVAVQAWLTACQRRIIRRPGRGVTPNRKLLCHDITVGSCEA